MPEDRARSARRRLALRVGHGLDRLHLARPAFRVREWQRARARRQGLPATGSDGLPLPPAHLQVLVTGGATEHFVEAGVPLAAELSAAIARTGPPMAELEAVLDFGVGCGRVARHWADLDGPRLHGCDYNGELVDWCRRNLPFLDTARTGLEPPLPYADGTFDLVYAYSVFTHMPVALQLRWIAELRRVLRADGRVAVSTHGDEVRGSMSLQERAAFDRGECAVRFSGSAGSNLCSAYHPRSWVEGELLAGWRVLGMVGGATPGLFGQDLYVATPA